MASSALLVLSLRLSLLPVPMASACWRHRVGAACGRRKVIIHRRVRMRTISAVASVFAGVLPTPASLPSGSNGGIKECRTERNRSCRTMAQTALRLVLLVGAGLLIRAMANIAQVPSGYNMGCILSMSVTNLQSYTHGAAFIGKLWMEWMRFSACNTRRSRCFSRASSRISKRAPARSWAHQSHPAILGLPGVQRRVADTHFACQILHRPPGFENIYGPEQY